METNIEIEFRKERDLGSIITDTFKFLRENWKGYFGTVIKIAGPALILFLVAMGYYMVSFGSLVGNVNIDSNFDANSNLLAMFGTMLVAFVSGVVFYVLLQMSSLYYIKSYRDNGGFTDDLEIRTNIKKRFWKFLGLGILVGIMMVFGFLLCFLPGVWIAVILSLASSIMVFENKGITDTIGHSFKLIKGNWWETFGVMIVVMILVGVMGFVFSVPNIIYMFARMFTVVNENDPTAMLNIYSDPIYLGLTAFSYIGQFLLSSITLVATVFVYYDLNEQKNLSGTIDIINNIGSN